MRKATGFIILGVCLAILAGTGFSVLSRQHLYIVGDSQKLQFAVQPGDRLYFSYRHSLYQVQQTEVFEVQQDNSLLLREMIFGSLNALYYYDEQNLNYYEQDGTVHLVNLNKSFRQIPFRASYSKSHVLTIRSRAGKERKIDVSASFAPGASLRMGVERWLGK